MKKLLLVMSLVPAVALAAEKQTKTATPSDDPMAGWVPPKVKNAAKDKQEIRRCSAAWRRPAAPATSTRRPRSSTSRS